MVKTSSIIAGVLIVALCQIGVSAQYVQGSNEGGDTADCACLRSTVRLNVSSVEKIILKPEEILENTDRFWQEDGAYQLVRKWHARTDQPLDLDGWKKRIETLRKTPVSKRDNHPQLVAARGLADLDQSFAARAIPYLCSYLPPEANLNTTLYFTTEIMASGFQADGDIVIHILNHKLQNLFVHEIFHRGFSNIYALSGASQPVDDPHLGMLLPLQNEGIATYVGYNAQPVFPNYRQEDWADDFGLLENTDKVKLLCKELNAMFRDADQTAADELRTRSWELGIRQRAYYVVGAFMARAIDEQLGREALIETIRTGPRSFVKTYNTIAADSLSIFEI